MAGIANLNAVGTLAVNNRHMRKCLELESRWPNQSAPGAWNRRHEKPLIHRVTQHEYGLGAVLLKLNSGAPAM